MPRLPRLYVAPLLICACLYAPMAVAQAFDGCDMEEAEYDALVKPALVGDWMVINGPGTMRMSDGTGMEMTMPLGPVADEAATLYLEDGTLRMRGGEQDDPYLLLQRITSWTDPSIPLIAADGGESIRALMDFSQLAPDELPNCSFQLLPLLWYSGQQISAPDMPGSIDHQTYMFVLSDELLAGVILFNGTADGMRMRAGRLITVRRAE